MLSLREKEFVEAARSLGASNTRILFRELLPNLVAPLIVYASLLIPTNILLEAALSYLGSASARPRRRWGQMISDASATFNTAWWYMVFPGARCCSRCSRSTWSETACWTPSTRVGSRDEATCLIPSRTTQQEDTPYEGSVAP